MKLFGDVGWCFIIYDDVWYGDDDDDDHDPHNLHKISIAPRTSPNQSSINRSLAAFAQLSPLG
jgi:hypothetical protein